MYSLGKTDEDFIYVPMSGLINNTVPVKELVLYDCKALSKLVGTDPSVLRCYRKGCMLKILALDLAVAEERMGTALGSSLDGSVVRVI